MPFAEEYCGTCLAYLRPSTVTYEYDDNGGEPEAIVWVKCDRCLERERKAQAEVARLEALWAVRECRAPGCVTVFSPARPKQVFCTDRCRKRTHRQAKAQRAAWVSPAPGVRIDPIVSYRARRGEGTLEGSGDHR
jgi:hypothetical protein